MSFALGLTGSIGMGKSTTAQMFADLGCAVWDADAAVHRLYDQGGAAVPEIAELCPAAVENGRVSRDVLKQEIGRNPGFLKNIEEIVHPLVAKDRAAFRTAAKADILVFDVPLLFETGGHEAMDAVACVFVSPTLQRERVLSRGTMTDEQFEQILAKQMPIEEKVSRADYVIETNTLEHARVQVEHVVSDIKGKLNNA